VKKFVGEQHQFHDKQCALEWANRFVPTPERLELFDTIIQQINEASFPGSHIVELGIGPGYLAERLLEKISNITYEGVDVSSQMLDLASTRLAAYMSRIKFTKADLINEDWGEKVSQPVGAIISTWALHDLGSEENTMKVYQACYRLLADEGILLNGDFVKPEGTRHDYEAGRFLVSRHLELLREVGFRAAHALVFLEHELENPTSAQNYACIKAIV
jgi:ubiquinone/menaquinone biosynthesis C-methylase UbiE